MNFTRLGRTGLQVSRLGLGTITFGSELSEPEAIRVMDRAAELGINHLDTADVYPTPVSPENWGHSEEIIGRWLRGKRNAFVVASKCLNQVGPSANDGGGSRKHVIHACEESLRRLQTDHIDIYYLMYLHAEQLMAPMDETFEALDRLVQDGKVLYIGVSNFSTWELGAAMEIIATRRLAKITALQIRYNLLNRPDERETLPLAAAAGYGVVSYNPLGGGVLAGLFKRGQELPTAGRFAQPIYRERYWNDDVFDVVEAVAEVGRDEGLTPAQVALAWLLTRPVVTSPLIGGLVPEHIDDNVKALEAGLSAASLDRLNKVSSVFV